LEGFLKIQPAILNLDVKTPGPIGIGTSWTVTRQLLDKETNTRLEISELERPIKLVIDGENSGIQYKTRYHLSEDGEGTLVEMDLEGVTDSFVASLIDKMTASHLRDCLEDDLNRLKAAAEESPENFRSEGSDLPDLLEPSIQ
jgi:carbon monoxide dehydrogenase subunit G